MVVGTLLSFLKLDKSGFSKGLNDADKEAKGSSQKLGKTFGAIAKVGAAAFLAVGAAAVKSVFDATKFEKGMADISSLLDDDTMPKMAEFQDQVLDMSKKFGEGTDTLSKGLYDIISASIPASDAIGVLEVATKAAKAGLTDTGTAADAITTLINAYGESADSAGKFSDLLFTTVKHGKTTFGELAGSIGNVATLASTVGLRFEEVSAALSTMTRKGVDTATATTNLRGILSALLKPSEDLTAGLGGMTVEADGFATIMDKIGGLPPADLAKMFPNVRALSGVTQIAGEMGSELKKINDLMAEGSPAANAFGKQADTAAFAWDKVKATLEATSIEIGTELLPTFTDLANKFSTFVTDNKQLIVDMTQGLGNLLLKLAEVTSAVGLFWKELNEGVDVGSTLNDLLSDEVKQFSRLQKAVRETADAKQMLRDKDEMASATIDDLKAETKIRKDLLALYENQLKVISSKPWQDRSEDEEELYQLLKLLRLETREIVGIMDMELRVRSELAEEEEKTGTRRAERSKKRIEQTAEELKAEEERIEKVGELTTEWNDKLAEQNASKLELLDIEHSKAVERAKEIGASTLAIDEFYTRKRIKLSQEESKEEFKLMDAELKAEEEAFKLKETFLVNHMLKTSKAELDQYATRLQQMEDIGKATESIIAPVLADIGKTLVETQGDMVAVAQSAGMVLNQVIADFLEGLAKQYAIQAAAALIPTPLTFNPVAAAMLGGLAITAGAASAFVKAIPSFNTGGIMQGNPGIDQNMAMISAGEAIIPASTTANYPDEIESLLNGESPNQGVSINPAPVTIFLDGNEVGSAMIEFITQASDNGRMRINPRAIQGVS